MGTLAAGGQGAWGSKEHGGSALQLEYRPRGAVSRLTVAFLPSPLGGEGSGVRRTARNGGAGRAPRAAASQSPPPPLPPGARGATGTREPDDHGRKHDGPRAADDCPWPVVFAAGTAPAQAASASSPPRRERMELMPRGQ